MTPELLLPAGGLERMRAATYGADAVMRAVRATHCAYATTIC